MSEDKRMIGEKIKQLGEAFRGLWVSTLVENGKATRGWACTVTHEGEYIENPYSETPEAALDLAIETLAKMRATLPRPEEAPALSLDEAVEKIVKMAGMENWPKYTARTRAILLKYRGGDEAEVLAEVKGEILGAINDEMGHNDKTGEEYCGACEWEKKLGAILDTAIKKHSKGKPSHCHDCSDVSKPDCPIQTKEQHDEQSFEDEPHPDCPREKKG